ncbi:hypothetical protein D9619_000586 [Psilocybe cf. subviscida]|uniref:Uncharacterized protein n=1 Tax=Psilocybe cf. subviscida TaxID=2480587 RepID=A0A8H5F3C3_9AGAR|nr:hypothetical protein D9619_000586 [Psilocybe cf. subviscida]
MASSASADVSPTTALFHSLWQVEPNPRLRRNPAADGFVEVKSDRPRSRSIIRSWSITADCGCTPEHHSKMYSEYEECEEVYNMLYVPPERPYSPPPPHSPSARQKPKIHVVSQLCHPPRADSYSLISDEEWRQAGHLPPFSFSLAWFCYLLNDMGEALENIFRFLIPTAWFYAEWIRLTNPTGTPWPGESGPIYVALPEPGKKDDAEYRIPFVSERIIETMAQQAADPFEDRLCVYNMPQRYEREVFRACDRLNLTAASVRMPAGVYDCIWVVCDGEIVRDFGAQSDNFVVVGKNSKLVDKVAIQTNRRSAALSRHLDYLWSRRARLMHELSENLAFLVPAKKKKKAKPRELSRKELLGDESALLASPPPSPPPSPPRSHRYPEDPFAQRITEAYQEEFLANNEFEMGMEYTEDEYIPYIQLY